jgi:tetratricopeptide (TPR) repeat protein
MELAEKCHWSKATNMYQYACFKFMILEEKGQIMDEDAMVEIREALQKVPELKKKIAGRTIPPEKFAITKTNEFLSGKSEMILPALELFYIWNIYGAAAKKPELLDPFIEMIDDKIQSLKGKSEAYYTMLLLKGVCLRNQEKNEQAIDCFTSILEDESKIKSVTYIPPHAAFELGLTHMNVKNYKDAKRWLERARDHYSGFLVESLVHLRIHGALSKLREITRGLKRASIVSNSSMKASDETRK